MRDLITHFNMQEAPPQQRELYDILRGRGSRGLSNLEAVALGFGSLSRRVCDLIEKGVPIRKERDGRITRYYFNPSTGAR